MTYEYLHMTGNEYLVTIHWEIPREPETLTVVVVESEDELDGLIEGYVLAQSHPPAAAAPQYPRLPVRDFLALFTLGEKLAVKAATRVSDELGLWYDEMLAAQFITAEDPVTLEGLNALVAHGLLTAERHGEIVASLQPVATVEPAAPV